MAPNMLLARPVMASTLPSTSAWLRTRASMFSNWTFLMSTPFFSQKGPKNGASVDASV